MKREDAPRARFRVGMVSEQDFGVRSDVFKAPLRRIDTQPFRSFGDVTMRLVGITAERSPGRLSLGDPAELFVHKQRVVSGPSARAEFPYRYPQPRGQIEPVAR